MQQLLTENYPQWHEIINQALLALDENYLNEILSKPPGIPELGLRLAAFSLPLDDVQYVLLGESPYPRSVSANGYAFWDNAVRELWSAKGLSKTVNRATSLRNFIKMLLVARGDLCDDYSQGAIAALDKSKYCQTGAELFGAMINKGFLLLNASLIYRKNQVNEDARQCRPFLMSVLKQLFLKKPEVKLILLGKIAGQLLQKEGHTCLIAEHPYNLSFITNPNVLKFFKPLDLLMRLRRGD